MTEPEPQRILTLGIEAMEAGLICLRELAFFETREVFGRISTREDDTECPWESSGWHRKGVWKDMAQLKNRAARCQAEGWNVVWNPAYSPEMEEFRKEAAY